MAKKSKRLSAKRVIALITAFLFVLSGMPLSSISAQAAVKKPTIAKSATLKVGTSKTIKISKGSYKIVSVKVSSSKKSVATVKASGKAAIKVTGKKAGKATITTRVKAKKGKTSKTFKLTTKVTVKKAAKPEPTVDTSKTVNTQDELVAALADSSITQITIGQDATSITIPAGDYSKVDLIVDAPNASITNNGVFKSITIKAIAANTWIEKAKGNRITSENEGRAHIVLGAGASVAAILVSSDSVGGITIEVTGGSVANLTITGTEKVNLVLSGAASVGTVSVEAASKVDIDATGSSTIEKVEVTEKAAGTATDKTVVNVKAEGSAEIKEITTSAANSTTNVTANGSADVAKVAVNGSANASIGGTSNKVTEVDIKGASKDAVVTVTTTTVKIEAAAGTDNEKIINNQSGKALTTEVTQSDGTKKETTTATDTTTPSSDGGSTGGGSTGGGSGSPAVSVASVTISGQAKVGGTLTATATGTNLSSISWSWESSSDGETWTDFSVTPVNSGLTSTITVPSLDAGTKIRVTATAGSSSKTSNVVTVRALVAVSSVSLDKTSPKFNETITATPVTAPADSTDYVTYQWYRQEEEGYVAIEGATSATYTTVAADVGKHIRVTVSGETGEERSAATTSTVAKADNDLALDMPATLNLVANESSDAHTYQVATTGGSGETPTYATSDNTKVTVSDTGLVTGVLATDDSPVTITITQAASATMLDKELTVSVTVVASDEKLTTVALSGDKKVGSALTAHLNPLGNPPTGTFTYQWKSSSDGSSYSNISGATASSYTVQSTDAGKTIKVEVKQNGGEAVESEATTTIPYRVSLAADYSSKAIVTLSAADVSATGTVTITVSGINSAYTLKAVKQGTTTLTGSENEGTWTYTSSAINENTTITVEFATKVSGTISYTAADVYEGATGVAVTASLGDATGEYSVAAKTGVTNTGSATINSSTGALDLSSAKENDQYTVTFTGSGDYAGTVTCDVTVLATPQTDAPTFSSTTATLASESATSVTFTLSAAVDGASWKVYDATTGSDVSTEATVGVEGTTLTLTAKGEGALTTRTYYVTATVSPKTESERVSLTVSAYVAPAQTDAPTFSSTTATLASADATSINFTLSSEIAEATWKVYDAATGGTESTAATVGVSGTTLTLTGANSAALTAGTYYVTATVSPKTESERVALTVSAYVAPEQTSAPEFTSTTATLASAAATSINFTLSSEIAEATWKVYDVATGGTESTAATVGVSGTTLTLTGANSAALTAGTYYVTATVSPKTESERVALTVSAYVAPEQTSAPEFTSTTATLASAAATSITFTLSAAIADASWKVYDAETGNDVSTKATVGVEGTTLTLTAKGEGALTAGTYYVTATVSPKTESERVSLTVSPYEAHEAPVEP